MCSQSTIHTLYNPGHTINLYGRGEGDFITVTLTNDHILAKNHRVRKQAGLIVTPDGSVVDTSNKQRWKTVHGDNYKDRAHTLRDSSQTCRCDCIKAVELSI